MFLIEMLVCAPLVAPPKGQKIPRNPPCFEMEINGLKAMTLLQCESEWLPDIVGRFENESKNQHRVYWSRCVEYKET